MLLIFARGFCKRFELFGYDLTLPLSRTPLTALLCNLSNIAPEAPDPAQRGSWVPDFQKRGGAEGTQHNSPAFEIMNTNGYKPSSLDGCVRSLFVLLSEA